MTQQEKREFDILREAGLSAMPPVETEDTPVWTRAIVKYYTRAMNVSYAIARNVYHSDPEMIRVFDTEGFGKLISVHPYKFLSESLVPKFQNVREVKDFLSRDYGISGRELTIMSNENVMKLLYNSLIRRQEAYEKQQERESLIREQQRAAVAVIGKEDYEIPTIKDRDYEERTTEDA